MANGFILLPVLLSYVGTTSEIDHTESSADSKDKKEIKKELDIDT
jgi:hypothetical protein